ncbi:MAG: heterodisulfide reductase-related iron-sulfur binding cluster [Blastocatellia bacterium]|nr:heterodisulfide reductase-related iron-sulfur binding cluster [Blastocatellia bacterium]
MSTSSLHASLQTETEKLLGCIHCGLCLPACPTYGQTGNENDSPRGRIYLMRAVAEGRLDAASETFSRHIDLCLGCRACETACPAGVHYGHLLETARETILEQKTQHGATMQKSMLKFALRRVFPHPGRLKIAFALSRWMRDSGLVNRLFRSGFVRRISPKADFALSLLMTTRAEWGTAAAEPAPEPAAATRSAAVFTGCVMEGLFKPANEATKRVLAVNGARNTPVDAQVCCGALHAHSGDLELARELARRNIDAFDAFLDSSETATIIINAAGCGALLKEYGDLLSEDAQYAARARRFSARVRDVTEFLAAGEIRRGGDLPQRVTYDAPCHLYHAQRVTTAQQKIFDAIPGLQYSPLEGMQDCCGGAGIYNLSEPEMSERLLSDKIEKVKATGADLLVTANPGCHMQLGAGVRMFQASCQVAHIVDLLDESYRKAGLYS